MSDLFVSAPDGLRLHVRRHGDAMSDLRPVVCLPGLARTTDDFDRLAEFLLARANGARQVLAMDYRGRGRSDYDREPANYTLATELADLLAVLTALEVAPAVFVGTSRGGLLAMLLAAVRPAAIAGVVLNDIGPVIESKGLLRIKSYLGRLPQPKDFEDAADILQRVFGAQFPKLARDGWREFARRTFEAADGGLVARYDPALATVLAGFDAGQPVPPLWKEFDALAALPLMVIRGELSDLLLADTVAAMQARRPDLVAHVVADEGHAPLLMDDDVLAAIARFVERC